MPSAPHDDELAGLDLERNVTKRDSNVGTAAIALRDVFEPQQAH
jgi:hypothetical protein